MVMEDDSNCIVCDKPYSRYNYCKLHFDIEMGLMKQRTVKECRKKAIEEFDKWFNKYPQQEDRRLELKMKLTEELK